MADKEAATKVDLGLLEEDDEFEEFPADGENGAEHTVRTLIGRTGKMLHRIQVK